MMPNNVNRRSPLTQLLALILVLPGLTICAEETANSPAGTAAPAVTTTSTTLAGTLARTEAAAPIQLVATPAKPIRLEVVTPEVHATAPFRYGAKWEASLKSGGPSRTRPDGP